MCDDSVVFSISEHALYRFGIVVANPVSVLNVLSVVFLVLVGPLGFGEFLILRFAKRSLPGTHKQGNI